MKVGDPIILTLQLPDGATDKYVVAHVEDEVGAVYPGSPFTLAHRRFGKYVYLDPDLLAFPSGATEIHAQYLIFDDSSHTQLSQTVGIPLDVFRLDTVAESLAAIGRVVDRLEGAVAVIEAQRFTAEITGIVEVEDEIEGDILVDELVGFVDEHAAA